jgi:hypothetical protein
MENFPEALYILTDIGAATFDLISYQIDLSSGRSRFSLPTVTEPEVAAISILSQLNSEEDRSEWSIANLASQWGIVPANFGRAAFSHSPADSYTTAAPSTSGTMEAVACHKPIADLAQRCHTPVRQNTIGWASFNNTNDVHPQQTYQSDDDDEIHAGSPLTWASPLLETLLLNESLSSSPYGSAAWLEIIISLTFHTPLHYPADLQSFASLALGL